MWIHVRRTTANPTSNPIRGSDAACFKTVLEEGSTKYLGCSGPGWCTKRTLSSSTNCLVQILIIWSTPHILYTSSYRSCMEKHVRNCNTHKSNSLAVIHVTFQNLKDLKQLSMVLTSPGGWQMACEWATKNTRNIQSEPDMRHRISNAVLNHSMNLDPKANLKANLKIILASPKNEGRSGTGINILKSKIAHFYTCHITIKNNLITIELYNYNQCYTYTKHERNGIIKFHPVRVRMYLKFSSVLTTEEVAWNCGYPDPSLCVATIPVWRYHEVLRDRSWDFTHQIIKPHLKPQIKWHTYIHTYIHLLRFHCLNWKWGAIFRPAQFCAAKSQQDYDSKWPTMRRQAHRSTCSMPGN